MFLRSWLSVRASEPCPIMISNRSKGLLRQIGARVDFLRKLRAIQHFPSPSLKATDPVPPPKLVRSGFLTHTPGLRNTPQINSANAATPTKNIIFHGFAKRGGGWVDIKWNGLRTKEVILSTPTDSSCVAGTSFPVQIFFCSSWMTWHGNTFTTKTSKVM